MYDNSYCNIGLLISIQRWIPQFLIRLNAPSDKCILIFDGWTPVIILSKDYIFLSEICSLFNFSLESPTESLRSYSSEKKIYKNMFTKKSTHTLTMYVHIFHARKNGKGHRGRHLYLKTCSSSISLGHPSPRSNWTFRPCPVRPWC